MTFHATLTVSLTLFATAALAAPSKTAPITLEMLLHEMTDLARLTEISIPAYTTRQFSSYDRRSIDPTIATEDNWFANHDRNQHLRVEENGGRTEYVLMDATGPGVVVRFWSANPYEGGIVRFYLDHQEAPTIELPLEVLLGGETAPFIAPLSGERGKGWNCYMPIPYKEHCKITISDGDIYYLINYRTYDADTPVTTFTLAQADTAMPRIRATAAILAEPYTAVARDAGRQTAFDVTIAPGASERMAFRGPGALYRLACTVDADNIEAALRSMTLTISFDDQEGIVSAPLGDFFGTAPGKNPYQSLPLGVLEDGTLYSHWIMPFKERAVLMVHNHGETDVRLRGDIGFVSRPWTDASLYFHAKWRAEADIPTRPFQDWNYMTAQGTGRYTGVMLHIANPVIAWWGEGDEKIYVDGESFPSHFGTGTEDYFGYAWCDTALFTHAYHNQIRCDGPGNFGHSCVSRFHIMDDIPFTESFRFDMEVWHWADTHITQAITAYWYAAAGASDNFEAPPPALLQISELKTPPGVEGALEGEDMRIISVTGGEALVQDSGAWAWSGARQLWWRNGAPGDALTLGFEVEEAGRYEVFAVFTKARDYGIHDLLINGVSAAKAFDFYNEEVVPTEEQSLGVFDLKQGENTFETRIVGSNPKALPALMFGLDYLRLEPR